MPEVQLRKDQKDQTVTKHHSDDIFAPVFPYSRIFAPNPFSWMRDFTREMDRAFRGSVSQLEPEVWSPAVDVQQCNGAFTLTAELPGLKKDEVKVEVSDDALIIEGDRKREHKEDHEGYHRWERTYGHFYRSIPLPEGAKTDQVKAELQEGVLKITVPVLDMKKQSRHVPVEIGAK